jgi:CheY-like chemotaxis protein
MAEEQNPRTILVVEDDPSVLLLVERLLRATPYRVMTAGSASAALRVIETPGCEVDLLLTDLMLGDLHGGELARRVREARPEVRVVYVSGLTRDAALGEGMPPADGFLAKPYRAEDLRRVLDRAFAG